MKTANRKTATTIAMLLVSIILVSALPSAGGDGKRSVRRNSEQTIVVKRDTGAQMVPRPVVDETPISPEIIRGNGPQKEHADKNRPAPKRSTIRR